MKKYILHITFVFIIIFISSCSTGQTKHINKTNNEKITQKYIYLISEAQKNYLLNNYSKAIQFLISASEINSKSSVSYYYLSKIFLSEKNYSEAHNFIDKSLKIEPDNFWYSIQKAEIFFQEYNFNNAYIQLKSLQQLSPKNEYLYNRLIQILSYELTYSNSDVQGIYDKLLYVFSEKEKNLGISSENSLNLYDIYKTKKNFDKAEQTILSLIKKEPKEIKYKIMYAELFLEQSKFEKAKNIYDEVLNSSENENPQFLLSYLNFCKITGNNQNFYQTIKLLMHEDIDINIKINLISSGQYYRFPNNQYIELLEILYLHHENDLIANTLMAEFYLENDKLKAIPYIKKAVSVNPSDFNLILILFELFYDTKSYNELYSETLKLSELYPNRPEIFLYNGIAAYNISKFQEAISVLNYGSQIIIDNTNLLAQFYYYLAEVYHRIEKNEESDKYFEKTISLKIDFYLAMNNYSYYLSERNTNLIKALSLAEKCINYQSDNPVFCDTYAKALLKNKKYSQALVFSEKANLILPDNIDFTENYGDILFMNNLKNEALKEWIKSKDLGNSSEKLIYKIEQFNNLNENNFVN